MKLAYEGVAEQVITLEVDTSSNPAVGAGTIAALSGNGKVKSCPVSTTPVGIVQRVATCGFPAITTWRWAMPSLPWTPLESWRPALAGAALWWMWTRPQAPAA